MGVGGVLEDDAGAETGEEVCCVGAEEERHEGPAGGDEARDRSGSRRVGKVCEPDCAMLSVGRLGGEERFGVREGAPGMQGQAWGRGGDEMAGEAGGGFDDGGDAGPGERGIGD